MKVIFFNRNENTDNWSDLDLINKYQATNQSKYVAILLERYASNIITFAVQKYSYDQINDFSNDLFIKVSNKLKIAEITNFKSWLFMLMKNMFVDDFRRKKTFENYLGREIISSYRYSKNDGESKLEKDNMESYLLQIKNPEQNCVRQLFLNEKSYKEIIKETGMTFNQIRGARDRGLKLLKQLMND